MLLPLNPESGTGPGRVTAERPDSSCQLLCAAHARRLGRFGHQPPGEQLLVLGDSAPRDKTPPGFLPFRPFLHKPGQQSLVSTQSVPLLAGPQLKLDSPDSHGEELIP